MPILAAPCGGDQLDLGRVLADPACFVELKAAEKSHRSPPAALEATLLPSSAELKPGASAQVTVLITNRSSSPATLDFETGCARAVPLEVQAYDANGKRADLADGDPMAVMCAPRWARIQLAPGGVASAIGWFVAARYRNTVSATSFGPKKIGVLSPGPYTLKVRLPMWGKEAGTTVTAAIVVGS